MTTTVTSICDFPKCGKVVPSMGFSASFYFYNARGPRNLTLCQEHADQFMGFVRATFPGAQ